MSESASGSVSGFVSEPATDGSRQSASEAIQGAPVRFTHERMFSTAHLYQQELLSSSENLAAFGACFTPYGHGHNYRLEVTLLGEPASFTQLLIERHDFEALLKAAVEPLDHHHVNFDVPEFQAQGAGNPTLVPTTENLCLYLVERLRTRLQSRPHLRLQKVRLFEMPDLWAEWCAEDLNKGRRGERELSVEVRFRAQHRILLNELDENENFARFGLCSKAHGHHYRMVMTVRDEQVASACLEHKLTDVLRKEVVERWDGVDLNTIFSFTTLESLVYAVARSLAPKLPAQLLRVAISDGETGTAEYAIGDSFRS